MPAIAYSPFAYDRVAHGVATWGMWGVFTLSELVVKPRLLRPTEPQPPDLPLWHWDDRCAGRASATWRHISDLTCATSIALPVAVSLAGGVGGGVPGALVAASNDALLIAEACIAVNLATSVLKMATRRHRPPAIVSETPNIEYLLSFPSGHTATAVCAATFATVAAGLRSRALAPTAAVGTVALALSCLTAMGRVIGSMHYFSDVVGGTFLGASVGFLVPWMARQTS